MPTFRTVPASVIEPEMIIDHPNAQGVVIVRGVTENSAGYVVLQLADGSDVPLEPNDEVNVVVAVPTPTKRPAKKATSAKKK